MRLIPRASVATKRGKYVPDRGDLVWLSFDPQAGREQDGRRPAVVLSPRAYNTKTNLAVCCPITSKVKGYPFEVVIPEGLPVKGVVLSDQLKSLDWHVRNAEFIAALPEDSILEILKKASLLVSPAG
ncbi:MAG: endoribonuclease MazF [Myxococcales bacterium]|nr:MAG: endoribonuclease MazF [Myxococcales bacterium]